MLRDAILDPRSMVASSAFCIPILLGVLIFIVGSRKEEALFGKGTWPCVSLFVAVFVTPFLCCLSFFIYTAAVDAQLAQRSQGCSKIVPPGFSEADLVGTWAISDSDVSGSMIIIRGDGRYKQIVNVEWQKFKQEADWKTWRVTYNDDGFPYLHLDGFLMCAYWSEIDCRTGQSSIEPYTVGGTKDIWGNATLWYDPCQKQWVETPGEGVFMVRTGPWSRGLALVQLTKSPEESHPFYLLLAP